MKQFFSIPYYLVFVSFLACAMSSLSGQDDRAWTNQAGAQIQGELMGVEKGACLIRLSKNGNRARIPLASLSKADQDFVVETMKTNGTDKQYGVVLPEAIRNSIACNYTFRQSDQLGVDSSGTRGDIRADRCQIKWVEDGVVGGAAQFNGIDSAFYLGHLSMKNRPTTVSCWIKTDAKAEQEIFCNGGQSFGMSLYTKNRSAGYLYRWSGKGGFEEVKQSSYVVTDGKWHHICAISNDKGQVMLWVNGTKAGPRSGELARANPKNSAALGIAIGIRKGDNPRKTRVSKPFHGLIDEFIIFDRALSELEVTELFSRYRAFISD